MVVMVNQSPNDVDFIFLQSFQNIWRFTGQVDNRRLVKYLTVTLVPKLNLKHGQNICRCK